MPVPPTTARRRRAAVVATALAAGTLALPVLAQPASAADPTTEVQVLLESKGGLGTGIYARPAGATDAGTDKVLVAPSARADYYDLVTSEDGSRFAYIATLYPAATSTDPHPAPTALQVVVRDIGGNLVRVAEQVDLTTGNDTEDFGPALSPDGSTVVWNRLTVTSTDIVATLRKASTTGGAPVTIPNTAFPTLDKPAFLDASTLVITDQAGRARTLPVTGGTAQLFAGVEGGGPTDFDVSPDGLHVAWSIDTTPSNSSISTADVRVADLALSGGTATASNAQTFATGQDNEYPSFSSDSMSLSVVRYDGDAGQGDVLTGPVSTSSSPTAAPATPGVDEFDLDGGAVDTVAPTGVPVPGAVTLNGTTATLRWTLPAGSDVSGVRVTRTTPGGSATKTFFASGTSVVDTGLTLKTEYDYTFAAVDRSGNVAASTSEPKKLIATAAPVLAFADPTSTASTTTPFLVTFSAVNSDKTVYDVLYRNVYNQPSFTRWRTQTGSRSVFGYQNAPVAVGQGANFQFKGNARDTFGNQTDYTYTGRAVVPFDQSRASFTTGVTSATGSGRYLGGIRTLTKAGQRATLTVTGNRFQVIGERSTTGGRFDVYQKNSDGSYTRKAAGISTYAGSLRTRQVLYTLSFPSVQTHTFVIKWVPGSSSTLKNVALDAFAARR